jgi:16S rRNA (guanine527-N7)-methyltransferase
MVEFLDLELLRKGARKLQIPLSKEQAEMFAIYQRELMEWNKKFNLTAVSDAEGIQTKHFLDSISLLLPIISVAMPETKGVPEAYNRLCKTSLRAIDVGTGPGFPGLALKIMWPALELSLVEATGKKVQFIQHIIQELGLENVTAYHARAEEMAHEEGHRESYDIVMARAVAVLPVLAEYLLPFAKINGLVLAMKGPTASEEVLDAETAVRILGGTVQRVVDLEVPSLAEERRVVIIRKVAKTPEMYPRRPGIPQKRPLGKKGQGQ